MDRIRIRSVFLILFSLCYVIHGDVCITEKGIEDCYFGCCNEGALQRCCVGVAAIIGLVVGGLMFLGSLVCLGFCIYYMCKKRGNRGTAVQPAQNTNSVVVHNSPYGHPPPGAPPSYNQYSSYPSGYSRPPPYSSDPAYPPGSVNTDQRSSGFQF